MEVLKMKKTLDDTLDNTTKIYQKVERVRSLVIAQDNLQERSEHFEELMYINTMILELISGIHKDIHNITMDIFSVN